MLDLYMRIWRVTGRSQITLIVLSLAVAGLAALPLQYQKDIINGLSESITMHQLLVLGGQYLGILTLASALKFALDYRSSVLSEEIIRRIRTRIYQERVRGQTEDDGQASNRGSVITMIAAEAEDVGKFVGVAIATPLMQLGTLVAVIGFIASTQPYLGLLLLCVVLPQAMVVLATQKRVNSGVGDRVRALRLATDGMMQSENRLDERRITSCFDDIYEARQRIFFFKLTSKFALNIINGLGTVAILVLGGWLVLNGRSDVGTVVAALSAMVRISQPWRDLITFYRNLSAVRVKYELLLAALPAEQSSD